MAKLITVSSKGRLILDNEDVFKLSNSLEDSIEVRLSVEAKRLLDNTFYTVVDENDDKEVADVIRDLYPSSIFKSINKNWQVGFCRHLPDNIIHYNNPLLHAYKNDLESYLPAGWKILYTDDIDIPIGNFILVQLFNRLNNLSLQSYNEFRRSNPDRLPKCELSEEWIDSSFREILRYVCEQPEFADYDRTYIYQSDRKLAGDVVRDTAFKIFANDDITLIGPEMESLKNVTLHLHNGRSICMHTISTLKERTYKQNTDWLKATKLNFKYAIASQNKNEHNFFRGLFSHAKLFGFPKRVLYIGAYPSFWLEAVPWFPIKIDCYDPKFRLTDLPYVTWHSREFTIDDCRDVQRDTFVYIDIRSDIRGSDARKFIDEDQFIQSLALELVKQNNVSVFFKRKVVNQNFTYGDPIYPPDSIHFGKEYYNYISQRVEPVEISIDVLFSGINSAVTENAPHYVYNGSKFTVPSKLPTIALYSLSNVINSTEFISTVLTVTKQFIVTFPIQKFHDWRDIPNGDSPFSGTVRQNDFVDHTIDPKPFCAKFKVEVVSEEVFVSILDGRINMPTSFQHLVAFRFPWHDFFSDRYFPHIGIRQPSIFARDKYRVSRLTAYINRRLTHDSDLSQIKKNNFEGYSGHLIAIETHFASLTFTMSPFRWIIRSIRQIKRKETSKHQIGKNTPHTQQEYENTYDYLLDNSIEPLHKQLQ